MLNVFELEEVAFRAWPAEEVVDVDGYRLRFTPGVTNRANSVWPNVARGELTLERRLAAVEAFYAARGLPAKYQLTSACQPKDLDARLAERGYAISSGVSVETAALAALATMHAAPSVSIDIAPAASAEWLEISAGRGRFRAVRERYAGLLARIGPRGGFALARCDGVPAGVGLGVVDGPWLGIFSMLTLPETRRRGVGRAVLAALTAFGGARGAARVYLQVEIDNEPARALYRASGFVPGYEYHYRVAPSASAQP